MKSKSPAVAVCWNAQKGSHVFRLKKNDLAVLDAYHYSDRVYKKTKAHVYTNKECSHFSRLPHTTRVWGSIFTSSLCMQSFRVNSTKKIYKIFTIAPLILFVHPYNF